MGSRLDSSINPDGFFIDTESLFISGEINMLRMQTWIVIVVSALLGFSVPANAAQQSTAEYSADSYMETSDGVMEGAVNVAPGKERREYVESGEKMIMIVRHDKKVVWMLQPEEKTYMEVKYNKGGRKDDISAYKIEQTKVGQETINGINTTKSKVIMTRNNGDKFGGFWWTTKEGIVVKMDTISVTKGNKDRFKTELKNLKIGKQKASLFEIPAGYSSMAMGMPDIGKMMKDDDDNDESPDEDATHRAAC